MNKIKLLLLTSGFFFLANCIKAQTAYEQFRFPAANSKDDIAKITINDMSSITQDHISKLTPTQFSYFSYDQLSAIPAALISSISPLQIAAIDSARLPALIKNFTESQIKSITSNQLNQLLTKPNSYAFSVNQISYFSQDQIQKLGNPQLSLIILNLTPSQIKFLTNAQVITYASKLSIDQFKGLSQDQIKATAISILSDPNVIKKISTTEIQYIPYEALPIINFKYLDPSIIPALTSSQIKILNTYQIGDLIKYLTETQIKALTSAQTIGLTPSQIQSLTLDQIKAMESIIEMLTPNQIAALSPSQIAALSPSQIAAFTSNAIGSNNVSKTQSLTKAQIQALSKDQIILLLNANFSDKQLTYFTKTQMDSLTPNQLLLLTKGAGIEKIDPKDIGNLTIENLTSLPYLYKLTGPQVAALTPEKLSALSPYQINIEKVISYLTPMQAFALGQLFKTISYDPKSTKMTIQKLDGIKNITIDFSKISFSNISDISTNLSTIINAQGANQTIKDNANLIGSMIQNAIIFGITNPLFSAIIQKGFSTKTINTLSSYDQAILMPYLSKVQLDSISPSNTINDSAKIINVIDPASLELKTFPFSFDTQSITIGKIDNNETTTVTFNYPAITFAGIIDRNGFGAPIMSKIQSQYLAQKPTDQNKEIMNKNNTLIAATLQNAFNATNFKNLTPTLYPINTLVQNLIQANSTSYLLALSYPLGLGQAEYDNFFKPYLFPAQTTLKTTSGNFTILYNNKMMLIQNFDLQKTDKNPGANVLVPFSDIKTLDQEIISLAITLNLGKAVTYGAKNVNPIATALYLGAEQIRQGQTSNLSADIIAFLKTMSTGKTQATNPTDSNITNSTNTNSTTNTSIAPSNNNPITGTFTLQINNKTLNISYDSIGITIKEIYTDTNIFIPLKAIANYFEFFLTKTNNIQISIRLSILLSIFNGLKYPSSSSPQETLNNDFKKSFDYYKINKTSPIEHTVIVSINGVKNPNYESEIRIGEKIDQEKLLSYLKNAPSSIFESESTNSSSSTSNILKDAFTAGGIAAGSALAVPIAGVVITGALIAGGIAGSSLAGALAVQAASLTLLSTTGVGVIIAGLAIAGTILGVLVDGLIKQTPSFDYKYYSRLPKGFLDDGKIAENISNQISVLFFNTNNESPKKGFFSRIFYSLNQEFVNNLSDSIYASLFPYLSDTQIQNRIDSNVIPKFTEAQIKALSNTQLNGILSNLTPTQITYITSAQIFNASTPLNFSLFSTDQIKALVSNLKEPQLSAFLPTLSANQLLSLDLVSKMSDTQIKNLNPIFIARYLPYLLNNITMLTTSQIVRTLPLLDKTNQKELISKISTAQIQNLQQEELQLLTPEQLQAFTPEQLQVLTPIQNFVLSTSKPTQITALTLDQVKALTKDQIQTWSRREQLLALTAINFSWIYQNLSDSQLITLGNSFFKAILLKIESLFTSDPNNDLNKTIDSLLTAPTSNKIINTTPLSLGSSGIQVRQIQDFLTTLGFSVINTDAPGTFGPRTQQALRLFQKENNLKADGVFSGATVIKTNKIIDATIDRTTPAKKFAQTSRLKAGNKGMAVARLHKFLIDQNYFDTPGTFGPATHAAVQLFQRHNNLNPDGNFAGKTVDIANNILAQLQ